MASAVLLQARMKSASAAEDPRYFAINFAKEKHLVSLRRNHIQVINQPTTRN